MNEIMARALTVSELAQELRYHDDPGVARLAAAVHDDEIEWHNVSDELEGLRDEVSSAEAKLQESELDNEDLKELLRECAESLGDSDECADLKQRISALAK